MLYSSLSTFLSFYPRLGTGGPLSGRVTSHSICKMGPLGVENHLIHWLLLLGTIKPTTITNTIAPSRHSEKSQSVHVHSKRAFDKHF